MYERGSFARQLAAVGPTVFGTWVKLPSIEIVEALGHAGFDFIVVDMEHTCGRSPWRAPIGRSWWRRGWNGRTCACRTDPTAICNACSTRVPTGFWCRGVTNAATCRVGRRDAVLSSMASVGSAARRAGRWGLDTSANYLEYRKDGIVRGVQVEDQDGLRMIDDILAVDGLSVLFIGTGDLSLSSGFLS